MSKTAMVFLVLWILSLLGSGWLWIHNASMIAAVKECEENAFYHDEERTFLLELLPRLRSQISIEDLGAMIRDRYPDDEVNVFADHIQWRFFQFWFNEKGRLAMAQYGS